MSQQSELFGIRIDAIDMQAAVQQILQWSLGTKAGRCRYVVTPNVDHTVLLRENELLQRAYNKADLVLADGQPIVWASRLLGKPVPERVPGSDLVPQLFSTVGDGQHLRIFLLGAAAGVADRAAERIARQWPSVETVGTYSPPLGFENAADQCEDILERIADVEPDVLVVGLGAPKQECWVYRHRFQIRARVALCVGATIDFLAGEKSRAPKWMRRTGLEWLFRLGTDPRRLLMRYTRDAFVFPQLVVQQWMADHPIVSQENRQHSD